MRVKYHSDLKKNSFLKINFGTRQKVSNCLNTVQLSKVTDLVYQTIQTCTLSA